MNSQSAGPPRGGDSDFDAGYTNIVIAVAFVEALAEGITDAARVAERLEERSDDGEHPGTARNWREAARHIRHAIRNRDCTRLLQEDLDALLAETERAA